MKADGVLNLLKFQRFQSVRMTSSLVRSTKNADRKVCIFGERESLELVKKEPRSRLVHTNGEQKAKPE